MKHLLSASFAALLLAALFAVQTTPVHADNDKLDFSLVNKTGYGIKAIYIAPSASTDWGDNLIDKPMENGDSLAITFDPKAKAELWDIRIEWVDEGDPVVWKANKLSEITKITLHYDRKTDETTAETE